MNDVLILNADGQPLSYVPLSVIPWQVAVRLIFLNKVIVLKSYDNWSIRSQFLEMKVPSIIIMTKQAKWRKDLKYSRNNVYLRDDFTCQLQTTRQCKEVKGKVKPTALTLDHVIPRSLGGKTNWLNVCTSCQDCNSEKGADKSIIPKKTPYKPSYYEILAKRKTLPIYVRDAAWKDYMGWPDELITVLTQPTGYVGN